MIRTDLLQLENISSNPQLNYFLMKVPGGRDGFWGHLEEKF